MNQPNLIGKVKAAIKQYNYYRSPEAIARLLEFNRRKIKVEFTGSSFCHSCGLYDWFDDFRYELMDFLGSEVEIISVAEIGYGGKFIVEFEVKNNNSTNKE